MKRRHFVEYSLLLIASCIAQTNNPNNKASKLSSERSLELLRLTVTDVQELETLQHDYGALQMVLEEILETPIELVAVDSYTAAAAALQLAQVDLVLTGPSEYVVIRARTNAVPLIGLTRPNYRSIICVSANSKIKSIVQLKGKTIAMWKVGSTSGHLGVTKLLIDAGLDPKSDFKILMLGSKGLSMLQNGEVDAWGGSSARYAEFLQDKGLTEHALPLIAKGSLLPNDLFVASSKLDTSWVKQMSDRIAKNQNKLMQSLVNVEQGKYKESTLVPANDSDYNMIREVYQVMGQGKFVQ